MTQETPRFPAAATNPEVVVVGNLTIDDVVLADGTTLMATLGGNSVHTAAAATAVRRHGRAGRPPRRGLPGRGFRAAHGGAARTRTYVVDVLGPTVRNWVIYEPDGRRHWVYRTPAGRSAEVAPLPGDVTPAVG